MIFEFQTYLPGYAIYSSYQRFRLSSLLRHVFEFGLPSQFSFRITTIQSTEPVRNALWPSSKIIRVKCLDLRLFGLFIVPEKHTIQGYAHSILVFCILMWRD